MSLHNKCICTYCGSNIFTRDPSNLTMCNAISAIKPEAGSVLNSCDGDFR